MQTDASAFEGWAICLKAWLPEYISEVKIEGERPSIEEKSKEERHYNRFLYRLGKFIEIYHSWASTTDDFEQEFKKIFKKMKRIYTLMFQDKMRRQEQLTVKRNLNVHSVV